MILIIIMIIVTMITNRNLYHLHRLLKNNKQMFPNSQITYLFQILKKTKPEFNVLLVVYFLFIYHIKELTEKLPRLMQLC